MHRRRVLQMGAAAAVTPLVGCGAPPEPVTPSAGATATTSQPTATPAVPGSAPGTAAAEGGGATAPGGDGQGAVDAPQTATEPTQVEAPAPSFSRVIARVGKNHGHDFAVSFADVSAGLEKTYQLGGSSGHRHAVTLSAEDMKRLLKGEILRTNSTKGLSHVHRLVVRCAPAVDPPEWISVCHVEFSGKDEHEMVIPAADMAAKVDRAYDIQGLAGHPHEVKLTAADFQKLEKGEAVSIQTSRDETDAHLHTTFIQYRPAKKTAR